MTSIGNQRGAALLTALILMGALSAIAAVHALNVRASLRIRGATAQRRVGYYVAEGGLNVGMTRFANIFRNGRIPQAGDLTQTVALGGHDVELTLTSSPGCVPCPPSEIPIGEVFAGLDTLPYRYTIHSESRRTSGDVAAHVAAEFDIHNIPVFQFLGFFDSHLFVMPLRNMTLHGRLHTNGDMYLQPGTVLAIEDLPGVINNVQVTAVGDIYRGGRKYSSGWLCFGNTFVDKLEDVVAPIGDLDPKEVECASSAPLPDSTLNEWLGSVRSGVHSIVSPSADLLRRDSGVFWEKADLRIVLRLDQRLDPGIDFSAADLCPTGGGDLQAPARLHAIEVQGVGGDQNFALTRQLLRFMCEKRGALFYTDVPEVQVSPPSHAFAYDVANYDPDFRHNLSIYRRTGEDTSGDGVLDSRDRNRRICPSFPLAGAAPAWVPADCLGLWPHPTPNENSWARDSDYRRGGFWNPREQQWMYLLNLNLRALIEWNEINGDPLFPHSDATDGGLVIFLTVVGPDSDLAANNYGVRIFDSADLDMRNVTFPPGVSDPTGVSVVSDQLAIIQGNFNTVDKYPAAVAADAVYLLSQGWETNVTIGGVVYKNDLKSVADLSIGARDVPAQDVPGGSTAASFAGANDLGINAALISGLGPSSLDPDWYNGGLENFMRMMESWDARTLNFRGSFVSLGESRHKPNDWECGSGDTCNVYDPPVRNFDYDTDFDDIENLPPLTPRVVYLQQRMYTRFYD